MFKSQTYHDQIKANIKAKLFKKIVLGAAPKREIPTYEAQKSRDKPSSRSKSIKFIKFR